MKYIKIVNNGTLAYKFDLSLLALGEVGPLAEAVDLYYLANAQSNITSSDLSGMENQGAIIDILGTSLSDTEVLLAQGENDGIHNSHEMVVAIALQMQKTAGNEYQGKSIGDGFSIRLTATQYNYENDSFGNDYDVDATFPVTYSKLVSTTNNKVDTPATINTNLVRASIPVGVEVEKDTLTLTVKEIDEAQSNVTVASDESLTSLDVHIDGVASGNTVPMIISINSVANKYLNSGNIELFHVENGQTIQMTQVASVDALTAHNQFYYDSASGTFTVAMASFSPVVIKQNTANVWKGTYDISWYEDHKDATSYTIWNADQLAGLSKIVGGMDGATQHSFEGKTIKLIADINLGYAEEGDPVFYPIGYYNNTGSYEKRTGSDFVYNDDRTVVYSSVHAFMGIFDGNGHKISNFYQNTWEMFGDYNSGYSGTPNHYKDGFGLFGWVVNGTVKNLRVDKFSCDSEFGISGVVAAYANNSTFENIAITNCSPGVYNNANGGIVGYVGGEDDADHKVTFKNITVDNTNSIRALWGTWDGCCAGILGRYDSDSKIIIDNCHVAAKMDVFNDVCGNYQYYWYRYSGMVAGSIERDDTTTKPGYILPDVSNFEVSNTTVHFGDWNNYYYCELVVNSLASYTHDHQMSRLTEVDSIDLEKMTITVNNVTTEIPKEGRYNYVVVKGEHSTENATCYHFVDGVKYEHTEAGTESVGGEVVLKEDKQHIYLPFNQVYQGWGWGVQNIPVNEAEGVSILDREEADSISKFEIVSNDIYFEKDKAIKLGDIFKEIEQSKAPIQKLNVQVHVTYIGADNNPIDGVSFESQGEWTETEILFTKGGTAYVTISDYYFCTPLTIEIHVHEYNAGIGHDSRGHWNTCACGVTSSINVHSYSGSVNPSNSNEYIYQCSICEAEYYIDKTKQTKYNNDLTAYNNKIFFNPHSTWGADGARYAVYYWKSTKTSDNGWLSLTYNSNNGYYEATIPSGYDMIIFCRMNGSNTSNNWENKWNQTVDIVKPTNGNNLYTTKTLGSGNQSGSWSKTEKGKPSIEYYVIALDGSWNNWGDDTTFVYSKEAPGGDGINGKGENNNAKIYTATLSLNVGTYTFKLHVGEEWYSNTGTIPGNTIDGSSIGWEMSTSVVPDCNIKVDKAGYYQFNYNTSTHYLEVIYLGANG